MPLPVNLKKTEAQATEQVTKNVQSLISKTSNTTCHQLSLIEHQTKETLNVSQLKHTVMEQDSKTTDQPKSKSSETLCIGDINKNFANVDDLNKIKKANSWASNYLQSIGHNNIKPIKINSSRNKIQRIETITTNNNETNTKIVQSTLLKGPASTNEVIKITDDLPAFNELNENIIDEHINVNNIKTLHPTDLRPDVLTKALDLSRSSNITPIPATSKFALNSHSKNKAAAYSSLLAKSNGKREIDILDAIKSNVFESNEKKLVTMSLPTHKDMCERFITEISKASASEMKRDISKLTPNNEYAELKKDINYLKEASLKTIKYKNSGKEPAKKSKSPLKTDNALKKEKNQAQEIYQNKKQQNIKPLIDLKNVDSLTKYIKYNLPKDQSPERKTLKRVHNSSEDKLNSRSDIQNHSPVRSVVLKTDNFDSRSPKIQCYHESFDLRSILSRVNQGDQRKQLGTNKEIESDTQPKERNDLNITIETHNKKRTSTKKSSVSKKKCTTLKLIVNVVRQGVDDETTSSDCETTTPSNTPIDMEISSFLDDFDVDDIVECLKISPNKLEENTKTPPDPSETPEPIINLETNMNTLHAKYESNKLKTSVNTECKVEESMKINSSIRSCHNTSDSDVEMNNLQMEEGKTPPMENTTNNNNNIFTINKITTKSQLDPQKSSIDASLKQQCESQSEFNIGFINIEEDSKDKEIPITDESVIITENEMSIIDLIKETLCSLSETNNTVVAAITNIQPAMKNDEHKQVGDKSVEVNNSVKDENENFPNNKTENSLVTTPGIHDIKNTSENNETETSINVTIETSVKIDDNIIDLTDETMDDEVQEVQRETEIHIGSDILNNEELHLIPLPDENILSTKQNVAETKTPMTESKKENFRSTVMEINDQPKDVLKNVRLFDDGLSHNDTKAKEPISTKSDVIVDSVVTVKSSNEIGHIKNNKNPTEGGNDISKTNKITTKENRNITEVLEKEAAKKVLKIVDIVHKNKSTSEVNENKNKIGKTSNETETELGKVSKTNNNINKPKKYSDFPSEHKPLALLLEKRMFAYLHKEINVVTHIRHGKYSNIFSCKNSSGETYAAKILKKHSDRYDGFKKELLMRQLQQDIPQENLNTIYLIDAFRVNRCWCFLTEYHPKNLLQALREQNMPFHIDQVQNLARQLITAVMVLRNNDIVHSDIKPTHILLNSTNDRLKLCGFDEAYYKDAYPLPNIGTNCYRAPEIILGFSASYSIDVWSSALVIYQMATNKKLFTGVYNNDILYKQMRTFGSLPRDMIEKSLYKDNHFKGRTFIRRFGSQGQNALLLGKFYKSKELYYSIVNAYNQHWMTKDTFQGDSDRYKISALHKLLEQMLLLDPRHRLAIEFVCADSFIYEMFK